MKSSTTLILCVIIGIVALGAAYGLSSQSCERHCARLQSAQH
ncbi:MAG TPA: hypothetical protein VKH81_14385 [Candidatus Angelobacter sp.]|nr:hypothetical protein [Candidatus Angelobacter sp.]